MIACPLEVISVHIRMIGTERTLANLQQEIIAGIEDIVGAHAKLIACDIVAVFGVLVDIDRSVVVFVCTMSYGLLTCRECPLVGRKISDVKPVGGIEKAAAAETFAESLAVGIRYL